LTGRDVAWLSPYKNEAEVLLPPGAKVRVRGAEKRDGKWIIYVDEVSKDTPIDHRFAAGDDAEAARIIQETIDLVDPTVQPKLALLQKMSDEAAVDPAVLRAFMDAHHGKTPLEVIAEKYPQLAEALDRLASK
jgi:hypothetical protein